MIFVGYSPVADSLDTLDPNTALQRVDALATGRPLAADSRWRKGNKALAALALSTGGHLSGPFPPLRPRRASCSPNVPGRSDRTNAVGSDSGSPPDRYTLRCMSIPGNTAKVVIQGHLGATEIFETGFWQAGITPPGPGSAGGYATAVAGIIGANLTGLKALLRASDGYDNVRVYFYPSGGPTAAYIGTAPITGGVGTSATGNQPYQQCMVATMLTGLAGRRNRGRMYLPATGALLSNSLFVTSACAAAASALAGMFNSMNSGTTDEGSVSVVTNVGSTSHPVTAIAVDNKADIQRRRANKTPSTITSSATVTP